MNSSSFLQKPIARLRRIKREAAVNRIKAVLHNSHRWPLLPFAIPVVVVVRLIRPWLLVRWGGLNSGRIGHFGLLTEMRLCEADAGINTPSQRHFDLFFIGKTVSNEQLATMWRRVHRMCPNWIHAPVRLANRLIPGGAAHQMNVGPMSDRDPHNLLDRFPPHINFTAEEEARGEAGLQTMGIPPNTPFVCVISRDSAYLNARWGHGFSSNHDYRDSDIQNYVLAAEELADRGYFVIRMGAKVHAAMNSSHPKIIDYAANGMRSDFMDIYLGAKCGFFVSGVSGFDSVPVLFRRPIVWVNFVPFGLMPTSTAQFMSITKHHYSLQQSRELTLEEIFSRGIGSYNQSNEYQSEGIQLIENSPEEIRDVVVEMVERLTGTWEPQEDDQQLQQRFWEKYPADLKTDHGAPAHGEIRSRYGAAFLRDNRDWLQ